MKNEYFLKYEIDNDVLAITSFSSSGNLAYQVESDFNNVFNNREKLFKKLKINSKDVVYVYQSHSDITLKATSLDKSKGYKSFESGMKCDGLYTFEKNVPLAIFHADCVPIFLYSKIDHFVGIIHAGYKGSFKQVSKKAIQTIKKEGINPENISVFIGPNMSYIHYHLQDYEYEFLKNINHLSAIKTIKDNKYLDVEQMNILDLVDEGINLKNIHSCNIDTYFDERCFSSKKDTIQKRMISLIMLKK